jgi:ribosome-binding protein aMBF1 (putative translation factor)
VHLSETITYFSRLFDLKLNKEIEMSIEEQTRIQAYYLWESAGKPEGNEADFWFQAEKIVAARHRLKEVRLKGISQAELAKKLGVSAKTVRSWERGERAPSNEHIRELEKIA